MSTTTAKTARTILKENGINNKQVSVRSRGGSVYVRIKDPEVSYCRVESLVKHLESYTRCEHTHEILCGGNTFVFVEYDDSVRPKIAEIYGDAVKKALDGYPKGNSVEVVKGVDHAKVEVLIWAEEGHPNCFEVGVVGKTAGYRTQYHQRGISVFYQPDNPQVSRDAITSLSMRIHMMLDAEDNDQSAGTAASGKDS
jgi:hypothetical protein